MPNVIICDDSNFMRCIIRASLEKNGYKVVAEASDGPEAISKYSELRPDFITMDINLGYMDGITVIKEIKQKYADAKIIVISVMGQRAKVLEAIAAGASNFIVKPYKDEALISAIKECQRTK